MFEDLFPYKPSNIVGDDFCPKCKSLNISHVTGVFVSSNSYKQFLRCEDCLHTWFVVFDNDLNIVSGDNENV